MRSAGRASASKETYTPSGKGLVALVKASAAAASAPPPPLQPGARSAAEGADFPSGLRRESSPNESAAGRDVRGRFSSGVSSGGSRDHQQHHCHPKLRLLRGTSVKPSEKSRVGTRLDRVMMMMRREWVSVSLRHVFVLFWVDIWVAKYYL